MIILIELSKLIKTAGILVDFAGWQPVGIYQVLNPKNQKMCLTKDVTFLNKSYG